MAPPGPIGVPAAASTCAPGVMGAARAAPVSNAGGIPSGGPAASADFAADLARLVALLGAARAGSDAPVAAAPIDADTDTALVDDDAADVVDALCAEVALGVPVAVAPVPVPASPAEGTAEPDSTDSAPPAIASDGRSPTRTLQALLKPPGLGVASEHRSAESPTPPSLPLLPAAAAGAAALSVVPPETTPDTASSAAAAATSKNDISTLAVAIAGVASLNANAPTAPSPHAVAATVVDALQPQAPRQMAETVAWHVPVQGAAEVQIRLNPEELGSVDVQLKLDGDKVSVRFDLADERVRDVVQSSLTSLSSMLSSRGLQLDQAQVFSQQRSPQQQQAQPQGAWSSARHDAADDREGTTVVGAASRPLIRRGLLDDYA